MVRQRTSRYFRRDIGWVSIEVSQLLEIIKPLHGRGMDVTAINGTTEFVDFDDIEKHKSQLQGRPTIVIDNISLQLDAHPPYILAVAKGNAEEVDEETKGTIFKTPRGHRQPDQPRRG